jgi:hypothetical protein
MERLLLVVELGGPTVFARIGFMRALQLFRRLEARKPFKFNGCGNSSPNNRQLAAEMDGQFQLPHILKMKRRPLGPP